MIDREHVIPMNVQIKKWIQHEGQEDERGHWGDRLNDLTRWIELEVSIAEKAANWNDCVAFDRQYNQDVLHHVVALVDPTADLFDAKTLENFQQEKKDKYPNEDEELSAQIVQEIARAEPQVRKALFERSERLNLE